MIDPTDFRTFLMIVCALAFVGAALGGAIMTGNTPWLHVTIKLLYLVLGASAVLAFGLLWLVK